MSTYEYTPREGRHCPNYKVGELYEGDYSEHKDFTLYEGGDSSEGSTGDTGQTSGNDSQEGGPSGSEGSTGNTSGISLELGATLQTGGL